MASANPSQLFLLADHIKLSLLERARAKAMNIAPNSQDNQIARSLDTLESGVTALESQLSAAEADPLQTAPDKNQVQQLRTQFDALNAQFHGEAAPKVGLDTPNDPSLKEDFDHAHQVPGRASKSVRFTDDPSGRPEASQANRDALFPYRDDPDEDDQQIDQSHLTNQQIHSHHQQVLAEQDDQLDRLGLSIGRQRDLSIAIGNELDDQVMMLDDVDQGVDRHQGQLDGARKRLGTIARRAKENWSMTTILVLICILVLLIIITK